MRIPPRLISIRNVQEFLLQGRRIGEKYKHDNSLTPQHQEKSPRGLEQRVKKGASSRSHSRRHREQVKSSGRLVAHTAAWLARLTGFLHNDLRRGCGVEMYKIDSRSRGQSEEERILTPTRLERLVRSRQRETAHAEAVEVREFCVENISVYTRIQPGGFTEHCCMLWSGKMKTRLTDVGSVDQREMYGRRMQDHRHLRLWICVRRQ
jgi:hypothetical protein